jgi:prevent-host-death family protein
MEVGVAEAKDRLSELIDRAQRGETVTITRHGRAAVTLNAVRRKATAEEIDQLFADIRRDAVSLPRLAPEDIRQAIGDGRKY